MGIKTIGVGDNVVDYYKHSNTIYPGGCSFNFSAYSSMLGNQSAYLGLVNNDYAARHIMSTADEMGIDTSHCHVQFGETPCPVTLIVDGERTYPEMEGMTGAFNSLLLLSKKDLEYLPSARRRSQTSRRPVCRSSWISVQNTAICIFVLTADILITPSCPALTFPWSRWRIR